MKEKKNKNNIVSGLVPKGSGAYIIHKLLADHILGYSVVSYNPYLELFPFLLPMIVSTNRPLLIHTTPDYGFFFYRKEIPLVLTFHNYILDRRMWQYSSLLQCVHYAINLRLWTRLSIRRASCITSVSHFTAQLAKEDLGIKDPIKVIYNGVDTDHFTPRLQGCIEQREIRVLFSGNLTRRKGAHWLPAIADELNKNIVIYYTQGLRGRGELPSHPSLKSIGPISFAEMPRRYQEMDILLMPTVREGLSLAVLEAMACGLPVVASYCSSLPEQIDDNKGGFLCPVGNTGAFAEKINLLADSPSLRKEMGEYNRAKVEKYFTVQKMVRQYKLLFEEVLRASA